MQDLIIKEVSYDRDGLEQLKDLPDQHQRTLMLDYPTVYLIGTHEKRRSLMLYVGETTDIQQRTIQHLEIDPHNHDEWRKLQDGTNGRMIVIGHEHFNKSLTLDIENQLMLYLSGTESRHRLMNLRTNPQGQYYPKAEKDGIFSQIWTRLHELDDTVFPDADRVRDSALFKASPFHTLTVDQQRASQMILQRVQHALKRQQIGQLILVKGEAGSGKTVLLSHLFYKLLTTIDRRGMRTDLVTEKRRLSAKMMVSHEQQIKVYTQIMTKLGLYSKAGDQVGKPTHYIKKWHQHDQPIDVILVDEAHLLYTQGKQAYQGENQLDDLLKMARVVIAVVDPHQVMATNGYRTPQQFQALEDRAIANRNLISLTHQLRMHADKDTLTWLDDFIFGHRIRPLPQSDERDYDLQIFRSPAALQRAIIAKNQQFGLSRVLATFDWPFVQKKHPNGDRSRLWQVTDGNWSMPWNLQLPVSSRSEKALAWAEQSQSINEVGSTFTIQGLDLNYAGVILGPSVSYENGRVVSKPEYSANHNVTQKRSLDGKKIDVAVDLLQNEVNVLMTRGVAGLYIYAVDPKLRQALLNAQASQAEMVAEDGPENLFN